MEKINASTKRGAGFVASYRRSNCESLWDCYGRFSSKKAAAENDCRAWCDDENGTGFKIMSYNTYSFTCGWMTADGLRVETPCRSILVVF